MRDIPPSLTELFAKAVVLYGKISMGLVRDLKRTLGKEDEGHTEIGSIIVSDEFLEFEDDIKRIERERLYGGNPKSFGDEFR